MPQARTTDEQLSVYSVTDLLYDQDQSAVLPFGPRISGPACALFSSGGVSLVYVCPTAKMHAPWNLELDYDIRVPATKLRPGPMVVHDSSWGYADSFVGPGATVGKGTVVGARSRVFRDAGPRTVVVGN